MKKVPMRMCIVTREKLPKKELIRIVKFDGKIQIDVTGKLNGKGCYLKKTSEVIEQAKKRKILNSIFETEVDINLYNELNNLID